MVSICLASILDGSIAYSVWSYLGRCGMERGHWKPLKGKAVAGAFLVGGVTFLRG